MITLTLKKGFAVALLAAFGGSALTYAGMHPTERIGAAREAILNEYLATYCGADLRQGPQYHAGAAAVLSRLTIKAGIGAIALAEYGKCRAAKLMSGSVK